MQHNLDERFPIGTKVVWTQAAEYGQGIGRVTSHGAGTVLVEFSQPNCRPYDLCCLPEDLEIVD